jgi:hypothetical protein
LPMLTRLLTSLLARVSNWCPLVLKVCLNCAQECVIFLQVLIAWGNSVSNVVVWQIQFVTNPRVFLFTVASILALKPTWPFIHWVPSICSLGLSGQNMKQTTHFHIMPRLRMNGPRMSSLYGA